MAVSLEEHFAAVFGARWPALRKALEAPGRKVELARRGPACPAGDARASVLPLPQPLAALRPAASASGASAAGESGRQSYLLDGASLLPPVLLGVSSTDRAVLDMCAAPGGKSLVLAHMLAERGAGVPQGEQYERVGGIEQQLLVCNDVSASRAARLRRVLLEHGPRADHGVDVDVRFARRDARRWRPSPEDFGFECAGAGFDAVLVDAPCSSEAHVVRQAGGAAHVRRDQWSTSRARRNAETQLSMALAAFDALRPGGRMVYSTCSINDVENDGVVTKLLRQRRRDGARAVDTLGDDAQVRERSAACARLREARVLVAR